MAIVGQIIDTIQYIGASWRDVPKIQDIWSLIVEWGIFHKCYNNYFKKIFCNNILSKQSQSFFLSFLAKNENEKAI